MLTTAVPASPMHASPLAITLDLDDTLWPVQPVIAHAEATLRNWMARHAPATAARFDASAMRGLRETVALHNPQWAHDLGALRKETMRRAFELSGDDPGLTDAAFGVFYEARQQVAFYDDTLDALQRLAGRFPLLGLTNGNADLDRIGLAPWFQGCVSARGLGVAKPDARIFLHACDALRCAPAQVLHVGDDFELDVVGAVNAGLQAVWLRRDPVPDQVPMAALAGRYRTLNNLTALADALLS